MVQIAIGRLPVETRIDASKGIAGKTILEKAALQVTNIAERCVRCQAI